MGVIVKTDTRGKTEDHNIYYGIIKGSCSVSFKYLKEDAKKKLYFQSGKKNLKKFKTKEEAYNFASTIKVPNKIVSLLIPVNEF